MSGKVAFCLGLTLAIGVLAARADVLLDTGTPNQTGNRSVFSDPTLPGAQFLAQEFSFVQPVQVDTIEVYLGGATGNAIQMDLTSAIGTSATVADIIGTYGLATPGTSPNIGSYVSASVNLALAQGDYFLVFSADENGGFLPINASTTIGNRYSVAEGSFPFSSVNTGLPLASDFNPSSSYSPGVRISGTVVPEPSAIVLLGMGAVGILSLRCRRRS